MARQEGLIKIKGSVGGLTFYKRNGQDLLRQTAGPDKKKIQNDPSFIRTRENNQEFTGAAAAAKVIRFGLVQEFREMSDSLTYARLFKLCKQIINKGEGKRGQRSFEPALHASNLVNFGFSESVNFDSIFLAPFSASVNTARTEVRLTIPAFNASNMINAPSGATHFRIIQVISVISSYNFDPDQKKYNPVDVLANGKNDYDASSYYPVAGETGGDIEIVVSLDPSITPSDNSALLSCIGIEFYQHAGTEYYLLASNNALKIQAIY